MAALIIKICGITRADDAAAAIDAGADWIGVNFWPRSKRYIDVRQAETIVKRARLTRPETKIVGVFVNQPEADMRMTRDALALDYVQLHGDEPPALCEHLGGDGVVKAVALKDADSVTSLLAYPVAFSLVDTPSAGYGGSGEIADWGLAKSAVATGRRILLAGGLRPENVAAAVAQVRPFGVDVASGVESQDPRRKDAKKMADFVVSARSRGPND